MIGQDQLELWARGLETFSAARARHDPARFCDVAYDEFAADPFGTVESIYALLRPDRLAGQAADAMRALTAEQRAGDSRPAHRYALADFGLDRQSRSTSASPRILLADAPPSLATRSQTGVRPKRRHP